MTVNELNEKLQQILPGCTIDTDNDGQLIVYTDKMEGPDFQDNGLPELVPFILPED